MLQLKRGLEPTMKKVKIDWGLLTPMIKVSFEDSMFIVSKLLIESDQYSMEKA